MRAMPLATAANIDPQSAKFYTIAQIAYAFGAAGHLILGLIFWRLGIMEMLGFNAVLPHRRQRA